MCIMLLYFLRLVATSAKPLSPFKLATSIPISQLENKLPESQNPVGLVC